MASMDVLEDLRPKSIFVRTTRLCHAHKLAPEVHSSTPIGWHLGCASFHCIRADPNFNVLKLQSMNAYGMANPWSVLAPRFMVCVLHTSTAHTLMHLTQMKGVAARPLQETR
jgi:hypothetical protein